jgi:hypothetical protein
MTGDQCAEMASFAGFIVFTFQTSSYRFLHTLLATVVFNSVAF